MGAAVGDGNAPADPSRPGRSRFAVLATSRARLVLALTVTVVAVVVLLVRQTGVVSALTGSSPDDASLAAALAAVPADSASVEYLDRAHLADRLGVGDVHTGASNDDLGRYLAAVGSTAEPGTALFLPALTSMQDAPFSELDVDWSLVGRVGTAASFRSYQVFRLDDAVDLDAVADRLVDAGFEESTLDGRRHLTAAAGSVTDPADGLVAGAFPPSFLDVTVDPDRHLLLVGPASDDVLRTLDGTAPSVLTAGTFAGVLPAGDAAAATEVLLLDLTPVCGADIGTLADRQRAEAVRLSRGMGTPRATAFAVSGRAAGVTTTAALLFGTPRQAAADRTARIAYLRSGRLVNEGLYAHTLGRTTVRATGDVVSVAVAYPEAAQALDLARRGDGFMLCRVAA